MLNIVFVCLLALSAAQDFSLRHSFQAPYHAHTQIPFWDVGGGGRVNEDFVRITPAKQSRIGYVWNNVPSTMSDWEVTVEFQVTGQPNLGGEGFAIWYVEKPEMLGPVYGSTDYWNGLGIIFDTYNNDNSGDFPAISVVVNDGRLKYDFATDGYSQASATCSAQFRNLDAPSKARIKYQNRVLTVEMSLRPGGAFEPCLTVTDLELGVDKFFGVSAQTGDVADNHDVFSFITRNLSPTNVNLDLVRERYRQKMHMQNLAESNANSAREMMDPKEFQDEVLGLLNQIQSAQNLMEQSQIAIANILSADGGGQQQQQPQGNVGSGNVGASDPAVSSRLTEVTRQQAALMDKMNAMQQALNQRGTPVNNGGGQPQAALSPQIQNSINTIQRETSNVNTQVNSFAPKINNIAASIAQCMAKVDTLAQNTGGESGGGSWLTTILMVILGMVLGYAISYFSGKRDRYSHKLP